MILTEEKPLDYIACEFQKDAQYQFIDEIEVLMSGDDEIYYFSDMRQFENLSKGTYQRALVTSLVMNASELPEIDEVMINGVNFVRKKT